MSRIWILALLSLSACSSLNIQFIRAPASVGNCNRQTLGASSSDNKALVEFNSKRRDTVAQLVQRQIEHLQSRSAEASVQDRLKKLNEKLQSISGSELKAWDEPTEVSYKLRRALEVYLDDVTIEEKAKALNDKEAQTAKYVRDGIEPNIGQLDYWIPDFCKTASGQSSPDIFKGLN